MVSGDPRGMRVNVNAHHAGCREEKPNRIDTTPGLTSRPLGLERRNSLRSLAPCIFQQ